ncbi:MAG TPA: UvrD-helicase domain-containing protein [Holophagaceae bacterium]|nr:UvrD-helicase domain-containing protein [Holophagaceae bacterium]
MRTLDLRDPNLLRDSLVVSASAGSGKTFTLTVLVTAALGRGDLHPWDVVATTFSEASAADLRERLLRPLDLLAGFDLVAWTNLLPQLGAAEGSALEATLKAHAASPRLAKASGEVAQAAAHWDQAPWCTGPAAAWAFWRRLRREAELLQVATLHSLALKVLGQAEGADDDLHDVAHPALLRLLRQTVREALTLPRDHPDHLLARRVLGWAERNWEELSAAHDGHRDALGHLAPEDPAPHRAALAQALAAARKALAPFATDPMSALDATSPQRRHFKPECVLPLPPAEADLPTLLRWAEAQSSRAEASKRYFTAAFRATLGAFQPVADALEAWMRSLLVEALRRFEARKGEEGLATFGDLVRRALEVLERHPEVRVAPKLLLVDEYQDTSRAQDAFLEALGATRLVRVGDVKQAIYGFRGGDPTLLRKHLREAGDRAFRLPANFRSTPEVVALANRFVDEVWPTLDAEATDLDGHQIAAAAPGRPVGLVRTSAPESRADLPALAEWIAGLSRAEGWDGALGDAGGTGPRRRALLLKQRTKLPQLLRRLKARGIQPYVVARSGFWESPGIRLLMAGLEAVAHPELPRPCAVLLRQVVGLQDAELAALAGQGGDRPGLPGLGTLDPDTLPEVHRAAAREVKGWLECTTLDVAGRLLRHGALLDAVAALRVHGALEPRRARRNLAAFLANLVTLPASPAVAYARLVDERGGSERGDLPASADDADLLIQTAHASKGLEYEDVILPLLQGHPRTLKRGDLRSDPTSGELRLAWKLGNHPGAAYAALKPQVERRQRQDDLNLLYVALTRAQSRLCLLLQEPKEVKAPEESKTWAQWGQHLAAAHPELQALGEPPALAAPAPAASGLPAPPPPRPSLAEAALPDVAPPGDGAARSRAREEGEVMHAFLRDLLVRWEDPAAFARRLEAAPPIARAREHALRFLEAFEARGWRPCRRRTELPLEGAAASGGLGRADLVVWTEDRIHLLDFKHSKGFGPEDLEVYGAQLARYAEALTRTWGLPVSSWLVPLRAPEGHPLFVAVEG